MIKALVLFITLVAKYNKGSALFLTSKGLFIDYLNSFG